MKININLAIRATDDTSKVKAMLEFLKAEGFTLTLADTPPDTVQRPIVQASRLATFGPNETQWREENPNDRVPVYSLAMKSKYPNGKEDMFSAALDGTLTKAAIKATQQEPNQNDAPAEGAVLAGPLVIAEPDESDYN